MNRREAVLALLSIGVAPLPAIAQTARPIRRIGYLALSSAQSNVPWLGAFREGMAELRWVANRDYVIDARYANGVAQDLKDLAAAAVSSQPDLLLTTGELVVNPLLLQTKTIPIVFAIAADPVRFGIAASLQRPGGNATGLTTLSFDISAKWLQLLKEALPRVNHVAVLFEGSPLAQVKEIEEAASRLGMRITPIALRQVADIESAFKRGAALGAQAYILFQSGIVNSQRQTIANHTIRLKVPSIAANNEYVEAGGLMSYSNSSRDNFRRAAAYVDKILKGADPGDLPIEQPTRFELVVNMKTAKAIGITFPNPFLLRVDRVIQ